MSTNHTTNYNLNQWEATDKVLRTDFNEDNAKIDAALKTNADAAASAAETAASLTSQMAGKGNCQVYQTTYVGNGTNSRSFNLPGSPMLVMAIGRELCLWGLWGSSYGISLSPVGGGGNVSFSWGSQSVTWSAAGNARYACNTLNDTYVLVALLAK